jgi:hypothetical protein
VYSRNWLREQVAGYLKDASVSAHLDTWIDIGAKRVSQILECAEMETAIENSLRVSESGTVDGGNASGSNVFVIDGGDAFNQDPAAAPKDYIELTTRYKRLVSVQVLDNGIWRNLRTIPKHEAAPYKRAGIPQVYLVENRRVYPLPQSSGAFRVIVLAEVEVPDGDNEDAVLSAYPHLFLNAALAEAFDWKQDENMVARYEQKWRQEAEEIRALYRSEHNGETPSMRAV